MKDNSRVYQMSFASVYPHYIAKATKKGRTQEEVDTIIYWLTGYNEQELLHILANKTTLDSFFQDAPHINPNVDQIKGVICGYRVEEIEEERMRQIRYLDKLIDELAKGKSMDKILRK